MIHPILEPLIIQVPDTALSRKLIEEERSYKEITQQLIHEQQWLHGLNSCNDTNRTGISHLEQNGYTEWLKDAEEEDFVRMVGVLQLILETFSALEESLDEDD